MQGMESQRSIIPEQSVFCIHSGNPREYSDGRGAARADAHFLTSQGLGILLVILWGPKRAGMGMLMMLMKEMIVRIY